MDSPELAIRARRAAFNNALAEADLDAIAPLLARDVVLVAGTDSAVIAGRKPQLLAWKREFAAPDRTIYTRLPRRITPSPTAPIAMEHGDWRGATASGRGNLCRQMAQDRQRLGDRSRDIRHARLTCVVARRPKEQSPGSNVCQPEATMDAEDTKREASAGPSRRRRDRRLPEIDGRPLKPATLMMGHGYDPVLSEGALKPPIFLTSTFAFESAAAGKRHFQALTGSGSAQADALVYSRFNGPDQEILEDRLSVWEQTEDALSFSSGMSAIATILLTYVRPGDTIVHSAPLYAATETLIGKLLGRLGVHWLDFPAGASREEIAAVLARAGSSRVPLIFLESPANPTNELVDIEAVRAASDAAFSGERPLIVMDNTFLGPLWQKPIAHGADVVVYSLTKYVGGHSDLVAGAALGPKSAINAIRATRNVIGTITDPHTAWMLLRSLETLELRMSRAGDNAAKVCAWLRDHPKVERVGYLGFLAEGGRQADIYRRHCTGAGSTFSLYLKGGEKEAFAFLDALRIAKLAVSLGGTETLASHPAAMTHLSVAPERKALLGISDSLVRISIGIEDADDLIADFDQALNSV
jgi:methionine-gamma-lyase